MNIVKSKDGTEIAYKKSGKGPLLILVDGAMCYSSFGPMLKLGPLMSDLFTTVWYDRRGRGESGDTKSYSTEKEVEDIEALIKENGSEAYIFGISSGAALAMDAATKLKSIKKIATYEPPFIVDDSHPPREKGLEENMAKLIEEGKNGDAVKLFMKTVGVPSIFIFMMSLSPMWKQMKKVAPTLRYDFEILRGTGTGKPLDPKRWKINIPMLALAGGKSPDYMKNSSQMVAELFSAKYSELEGQTHMVKEDILAPKLKDFFNE